MNLAESQVKNTVGLRSANNGTVLKSSAASILALTVELCKGCKIEIFISSLEF
jgi:hypothetical protein